jgi:hypothetical protein
VYIARVPQLFGRLIAGAVLVATTAASSAARAQSSPEVDHGIWIAGGGVSNTLTRSGAHPGGYAEARSASDILFPSLWYHATADLRIGGEGGEVAGLFSIDLAFAAALARSPNGALLLGGGLFAEKWASSHLGATAIEPYALVGYRASEPSYVLLVAARGGLVATGEYAPDIGLSRDLMPAFDAGAQATFAVRSRSSRPPLGLSPLIVTARWASMFVAGSAARVDTLQASTCATIACADLRFYRGDVTSATGAPLRAAAAVGGLSLFFPIEMLLPPTSQR